MSIYAVVDPATGETVKEYPTITDDELRDSIARADRAHQEWSKASTVADAPRWCGASRAALRTAEGARSDHRRRDGKPVGQARGEVDFWASIYEF